MRKIALLAMFMGLGLVKNGIAQDVSRPCGDTPPVQSAAWSNFLAAVENNYGNTDDLSEADKYKIFGHAVARYSAGVGRGLDAECVRLKLELDAVNAMMFGSTTDHTVTLRDAEAGRYDQRIVTISGVSVKAPFTDRDLARSGENSFVAGESFRGRFGLSDGRRVYYEDGTSEPLGDDAFDFGDDSSMWEDLPNKPETNNPELASGRGYMMDPPPGVNDENNWLPWGRYHDCIVRARNTYNGNEKVLSGGQSIGGVSRGAILGIGQTKEGKYRCFHTVAPFLKRYAKEMQEREQKMLEDCRRLANTKWCRTWYVN